MTASPGSGSVAHRGGVEFVLLMAAMMSLVALCIDVMLPAFPWIAADLDVAAANDVQLVVATMFLGLAVGQPFYGPLSDSIGRKPAMHAGFALLAAGTLLALFATSFPLMLAGRFLQGLGAAGPRTVSIALVRDRFQGSDMARIMSFIMTVFILVPILAPAVGQGILLLTGNWRSIFVFILLFSFAVEAWLALRQPETLPPAYRRPFTLVSVRAAFLEVLRNRPAMIYTLVAGCSFGAFMGYLNTCQPIFGVQYGLGALFPLVFAGLALAAGLAAMLNGHLVVRFGMQRLTFGALYLIMALSWLLLLVGLATGGQPPLWLFLPLLIVWFFCIGFIFGNINAMAMEYLGHVAGSAAAVIGTLTTLLAVALGYLTGRLYDGTVLSLVTGFAVLTTISVLLTQVVSGPAKTNARAE
jgi:DHA1 family bicyclomycin/chloramphenicol resistance-like MFS transporter